ncbi:hypothetical protein IMZ28_06840 [Sulfurovum indicum]|uniref:Uncharacterized protein n=1 Tax=Sulfurovum indicum TaxID=2779528 RepID=A0A7M1S1S0_9BACT|nr:hypothetical protein [Sulfurovum indicum]QOR61174.1 hypothetical protein IMZ28_06840 [Sulfurovum indicum]
MQSDAFYTYKYILKDEEASRKLCKQFATGVWKDAILDAGFELLNISFAGMLRPGLTLSKQALGFVQSKISN